MLSLNRIGLVAALGSCLGLASYAQEPAGAPPTTTDAQAAPAAKPPVLGPDGKPLPAATNVKGKKKKKEKPPKMTPVSISRGVLTVDGWAGKAAMNYDIADLKYIYISVPGTGTAVISNVAFPGAKEQTAAFADTSLKVTVDNHLLEVSSDKRLLGKKPVSAFVYLDTAYTYPSTYPTVGYGVTAKAPYAWPGSKPNIAVKGIAAEAPPVPKNLQPVMVAPAPPKPVATKAALTATAK